MLYHIRATNKPAGERMESGILLESEKGWEDVLPWTRCSRREALSIYHQAVPQFRRVQLFNIGEKAARGDMIGDSDEVCARLWDLKISR